VRPGKRKPNAGGRWASDAVSGLRALYGKDEVTGSRSGSQSLRAPAKWRDRLPDPAGYYGARVVKLGKPNGDGWAQGRCPFHDDHDASLSVNLVGVRGCWKCFAGCGAGDMVAFQMRLSGSGFVEAVRELVGVRA
jgi:hypothetical protein